MSRGGRLDGQCCAKLSPVRPPGGVDGRPVVGLVRVIAVRGIGEACRVLNTPVTGVRMPIGPVQVSCSGRRMPVTVA